MNCKIVLIASMTLLVSNIFGQNVGIGETAPANKLSVKGSLSVGSTYSTTAAPTNGAIILGNVGIGTPSPGSTLDVNGVINASTGFKIGGVGATAGNYLRGNGTNFVAGTIQASDVPVLNQNTTGSAASFTGSLSGDVTGTQGATYLSKIQGTGISISALASGNLLQYNGTNWVNVTPASAAVNIYTSDGTLAGTRTVTMGNNNLIFNTTGTGNMILGTGEAGSSPAGGTLRAPNAGSGNTAGGALNVNGGYGWGSGAGGSVFVNGGSAGGSGGTNGNVYLRGGYGNSAQGAVYINDNHNGSTFINQGGGSVTIGSLGTGLVKSTGGLLSIATAAVDYQAPIAAGTGLYYSSANTLASYWTLSGSNLYNNNGGNIGIGTGGTAPNTTLSVNGSSSLWNQGKYLVYSDAGSTQRGYWGPGRNNDMTLLQSTSNWMRISNPSQISFWTNGNGATDDYPQAYINSSGVVGGTGLIVGVVNSGGTTTAGTQINNLQAGNTAISPLSGCGGGGCVQTVTISYNFPSGVTPNIVCTVQSQSGTSYNDTYVAHVRYKSNTSATINICRQDAYYNGEGWGQNATLSWMAWY